MTQGNEVVITVPEQRKRQFNLQNNFIPESEFLSASPGEESCTGELASFYNKGFRFGFNIMYFILMLITLAVSPFLGAAAASLEFLFSFIRMLVRPLGKAVADVLGYGTFLSARTAQIQVEMSV